MRFFVAANLASGVDHMFVFLDAPKEPGQPEVAAALADHPHVTCIPTGRGLVAGRPAGQPERAAADQRELGSRRARAVRLGRVAVPRRRRRGRAPRPRGPRRGTSGRSTRSGSRPGRRSASWTHRSGRPASSGSSTTRTSTCCTCSARRRPDQPGVLPRPRAWGSPGCGPGSGLAPHPARGGLRRRRSASRGTRTPALRAALRRALGRGVRPQVDGARPGRSGALPRRPGTVGAGARAWSSSDLPDGDPEKYLRRIYDLTTRDDVELLADLQLLVEHDPMRGGHGPAAVPRGRGRAARRSRVAGWRGCRRPATTSRTRPRAAGAARQAQRLRRAGPDRRPRPSDAPSAPAAAPDAAAAGGPCGSRRTSPSIVATSPTATVGDLGVGHRRGAPPRLERPRDPQVAEVARRRRRARREVVDRSLAAPAALLDLVRLGPEPLAARAAPGARRRGTCGGRRPCRRRCRSR